MRRELGGFEGAQAWTGASFPYNLVAVLRLRGRVRTEALAPALAAVQRRHPLLRVRLALRGTRWWFESAAGAVPLRRIERAGEDHWRTVAEEELDLRLETGTAPLARCALLSPAGDGTACELVLTLHHAIADATATATVCRQLLELIARGVDERATDRAAAGAPAELPPAPDRCLPARYRGLARYPPLAAFLARQLADEAGYLWRSRGVRCPVPAGPARCRVLTMELGAEATEALIRRSRRQRVPLNGALNAALLLAVQRHRYGGRALPLRYFAFPDLRPHLEPRPEPETVAAYLTTMRFTLDLSADERFWELARRISEQLLRSFRRGEKFLFCLTSAALLRMVIGLGRVRFGAAAVSYSGPFAFPPAFGELEVRGLHAFVSNITVGAEYVGQARLYRGRLCWDAVYLDVDMDQAGAAAIAGDILARLEEAGQAA